MANKLIDIKLGPLAPPLTAQLTMQDFDFDKKMVENLQVKANKINDQWRRDTLSDEEHTLQQSFIMHDLIIHLENYNGIIIKNRVTTIG